MEHSESRREPQVSKEDKAKRAFGQFLYEVSTLLTVTTVRKLATVLNYPPSDIDEAERDENPGYIFVKSLREKGIITSKDVSKLVDALKAVDLQGISNDVMESFRRNLSDDHHVTCVLPSKGEEDDVCETRCIKTCKSITSITKTWKEYPPGANPMVCFEGTATIPVTKRIRRGWAAQIFFQNQVTVSAIWDAKEVSFTTTEEGFTIYTVKDSGWNADVHVGGTIAFGFNAKILDNQYEHPFYVKVHGQPECECQLTK